VAAPGADLFVLWDLVAQLRQTHQEFWDRIDVARVRQEQMLANDTGYNVSPTAWDGYPTIGRDGTYLTDEAAITDILGPLNTGGGDIHFFYPNITA